MRGLEGKCQREAQKPLLGVMPRWLFLEKRIEELIKGISKYSTLAGIKNIELVIKWTKELSLVLGEYYRLKIE